MSLPRRQFLAQAGAGLAGTLLTGLLSSAPGCVPARSAVRGQLRGGVAAVPVTDAPRVTTVVAWPPHSRSQAVARLVETALRL